MCAFVPLCVLVFLNVWNLVALVFYFLVMVIPITLNIIYGEGNFSKFKITGPFQVGF